LNAIGIAVKCGIKGLRRVIFDWLMDILLLKFQSIESNLVGAFIGLRYRRVQEYVTVLIMKGHVCSTLQMFTVAIILNTINEKQ